MGDAHQDLADKLMLLVDGIGPDIERAELSRHVDGCAACRAELQGLQQMTAGLRQALGGHPSVEALVEWAETARPGPIEIHLGTCALCREHVDLLRDEAARPLEPVASESIPAALLAQLAPVSKVVPLTRRTAPARHWLHTWGVLIAACAMVFIGWTTTVLTGSHSIPPAAVSVQSEAPAGRVTDEESKALPTESDEVLKPRREMVPSPLTAAPRDKSPVLAGHRSPPAAAPVAKIVPPPPPPATHAVLNEKYEQQTVATANRERKATDSIDLRATAEPTAAFKAPVAASPVGTAGGAILPSLSQPVPARVAKKTSPVDILDNGLNASNSANMEDGKRSAGHATTPPSAEQGAPVLQAGDVASQVQVQAQAPHQQAANPTPDSSFQKEDKTLNAPAAPPAGPRSSSVVAPPSFGAVAPGATEDRQARAYEEPLSRVEAQSQSLVDHLLPGRSVAVAAWRTRAGDLHMRVSLDGHLTPLQKSQIIDSLVARFGLRSTRQVEVFGGTSSPETDTDSEGPSRPR